MPLSSRIALPAALVALFLAAPAAAQEQRMLDPSDPQAQLLGYYAAAVGFTPVGLPRPGFSVGATVGLIPSLSVSDRTVGFGGTKIEDTNGCAVYPRLTAGWMSRRGFAVEAGYTPSAGACDVSASVASLALSYRFVIAPTWDAVARLAVLDGTVEGSFTCSATAVLNAADLTCYGGAPSNDRLATGSYGLDLAFARRGRLEPYAMVGFAHEGIDFDVSYDRNTPNPGNLPELHDHNRMSVTLTHVHLALGAGWQAARILHLGGEVYYEPMALLTVRGGARVTFGGPR